MRVVLVLLFAVCVSSKPNKEVESTEQESENNQNYQPMLTAMIDNLKDGLDVMKHTVAKMDLETCQETNSMDGHIGTKMFCDTQLQADYSYCRDRCGTLRTFSGRSGCKSAHWFIYMDLCYKEAFSMACSEKYLPLWPSGKYGLPMPNSLCPGGISWRTGYNTQITEEDLPTAANPPPTRAMNENEFSPDSFLYGFKDQVSITQGFCMKEDRNSGTGSWPRGRYCIYKAIATRCPSEFQDGSVTWEDEQDPRSPINAKGGSLPDGTFGDRFTVINFCCRDDGNVRFPVNLPVGRPFILFRQGSLCQQVREMRVLEESVKWDTDDTRTSTSTGFVPANEIVNGDTVRLHYCYYY